ncbi:hypothetical protein PAPYR_1820 [Paratrimastix pyriformis]|uniref:Uncharacterized protein n=1 Tax=Paratrimastix pyriformis TaxID=342808 RepID=A0ABQ8US93_9EUKA|nr:hypothetical protein PAPYR_1820 [Paratrimastix pyriformis]
MVAAINFSQERNDALRPSASTPTFLFDTFHRSPQVLKANGPVMKKPAPTPHDRRLCMTFDRMGRPVNGLPETPSRRCLRQNFEESKSVQSFRPSGKAHPPRPISLEYVPQFEQVTRSQRFAARFASQNTRQSSVLEGGSVPFAEKRHRTAVDPTEIARRREEENMTKMASLNDKAQRLRECAKQLQAAEEGKVQDPIRNLVDSLYQRQLPPAPQNRFTIHRDRAPPSQIDGPLG